MRATVLSQSDPRLPVIAPSFQQPYSFRQFCLCSIGESPAGIVFVGHTFKRGPLAVMLLHTLSAGAWVGQMEHNACPFNLAAVRDHLRYATLIHADAMAHQRFIVASGAFPQALAGQ